MKFVFALFGSFLLFAQVGMANPLSVPFLSAPPCVDLSGNTITNSNTQVLNWLHTTKKNFTARALVTGTVVKRYADRTGHAHFAIDMNGDHQGDLEVIYQYDAGKIPTIQNGMQVATCGDYITDPKGSPNGGIIHWIHCRSRPGNHPDGYLMLNGTVYGFAPQNGETCVNPLDP